MDTTKLWSKVLEIIKDQVSAPNFRVWFSHTKIDTVSNGKLVIKVPSTFVKDELTKKYAHLIEQVLEQILGEAPQVDFKVSPSLVGEAPKEDRFELEFNKKAQLPAFFGLSTKFTMNNFVVGLSNNLAYAAAQAVIANPGISYNPLFIYGGTGVGKTHLMQAIGNSLFKNNPAMKIIYCSSEKFMNDFVASIQSKRTGDFKAKYRNCDLLLIDDIQFMSGRDSTQEEFFHTFNELQVKNSQIVLTSDRAPNDIQKLEPRLQSRFQGGLMVDIQLPDFDTRVAILKAKSYERGDSLPQDILTIIAENMPTNARELEGKLIQIVQSCKLTNQSLTIETIKAYFSTPIVKSIKLDQKTVILAINQYFKTKTSDLTGPRRNKQLVFPRQIAMYLLYEECGIAYERIGDILGGRDHTTILHGVGKIRQAIQRDREIQRIVIEVKQTLSTTNS